MKKDGKQKYDVWFEPKCKPLSEYLEKGQDSDVSEITCKVYAEDIESAMKLAWQSVTVSPNEMEIVGIHRINSFTPDRYDTPF